MDKATIEREVTKLFEQALNYCEVACPEANYRALRSRILRLGNDCIRNLTNEFEGDNAVKKDKI